jgi:cytidylate kinase
MVIAIDGPAGAGKSTVARGVAERLDFTYLDSGAMYRAAALAALGRGDRSIADVTADLRLELGDRVIANGVDVTDAIRSPQVTEAASKIATDKNVRAALVDKQRELLSSGDWVAEGRDIGTVVWPAADLKIFLTASPEERARRRAAELGTDWRTVLQDQTLRDEQDRRREHSPLRAAEDAIELDSTGRPAEDVVSQIVSLVRKAAKTR